MNSDLGRRPIYHGPRQAVDTQAALCEKSATGVNVYTQSRPKKRNPRYQRRKTNKQSACKNGITSLNVMQLNICGLRNKKLELAQMMNDKNIHVALLQETLHKDADLHITGFTSYACKCTNCRGLVTYIRNDIMGDVNHQSTFQPTDVQRATIWHNDKKYTIYNVYNPPQSTINLSDLDEPQYSKTLLAGDFNGHSPLWGYQQYNRTGKVIEDFCESSNFLVMQNSESPPTLLHRAHLSLSRPDLTICSSDLENSCRIYVLDDIGSDHLPILTKIQSPCTERTPPKTRWNFKKANWALFKESSDRLLSQIEIEDVEQFTNDITKAILEAASQHIPRGYRRNYKPFWNEELQSHVSERRKARNNLEKSPSTLSKIEYNRTSARVKLATKKAKKGKWSETCKNLDLRQDGAKAWSLVNNLCGENRRTNPNPLNVEHENITSDQKKAEHFNRYFASVNRAGKLTTEDKERLRALKRKEKAPTVNNSLFDDEFSKLEFDRALKKLKLRKAPGPDKIHNEMLHGLGQIGKETILKLINLTWHRGELPRTWKLAYLTPILKKNKPKGEPKSYRPISLTSCLGKLAERIINARLYWFLESTDSICPEQAGFRAQNCTEDQLFRLVQSAQDGFQGKKHTLATFIDLQQAYDRVWRKGLLMKLLDLGIHGRLYKWIKFFLTDRLIQTKQNNALSSKEVLEEGLPQGSAISCTLFLVFINDLVNVLKTEKALYADDLVMWQSHEDINIGARIINNDLKALNDYCQKWKLKVNCDKSNLSTPSSPQATK